MAELWGQIIVCLMMRFLFVVLDCLVSLVLLVDSVRLEISHSNLRHLDLESIKKAFRVNAPRSWHSLSSHAFSDNFGEVESFFSCASVSVKM